MIRRRNLRSSAQVGSLGGSVVWEFAWGNGKADGSGGDGDLPNSLRIICLGITGSLVGFRPPLMIDKTRHVLHRTQTQLET